MSDNIHPNRTEEAPDERTIYQKYSDLKKEVEGFYKPDCSTICGAVAASEVQRWKGIAEEAQTLAAAQKVVEAAGLVCVPREPSIEWLVCIIDGKIMLSEEFVYAVSCNNISEIDIEQSRGDFMEYVNEDDPITVPEGAEDALFLATNITWQDGQITFPEMGYDFPPGYEMEVKLLGFRDKSKTMLSAAAESGGGSDG